jgi:hypothetical protein
MVAVPVEKPENWTEEPAGRQATQRFMSEDEDAQMEESGEEGFFSAVAAGEEVEARCAAPEQEEAIAGFERETEPARPQFDELVDDPFITPLPRDYAADFAEGRDTAERESPAQSLFPENEDEAAQRDLDVPAFMRRVKF